MHAVKPLVSVHSARFEYRGLPRRTESVYRAFKQHASAHFLRRRRLGEQEKYGYVELIQSRSRIGTYKARRWRPFQKTLAIQIEQTSEPMARPA